MLFNSIDFAIFLPIVFALYWFVFQKNARLQNLLVVVSSYVFYGWWDWRFLSLVFFSTVLDYVIGLKLYQEHRQSRRKALLLSSVLVNLCFLGFFKYYNFFVENFVAVFSLFGRDFNVSTLNIILPVGISFYTFQTMSYTIDIYRKKFKPTTDFVACAAYVSFFPQLMAGPIERASRLLPQFYVRRTFDYSKAVDGLRQILWGLVKKVVIADNAAVFANRIFNDSDAYSGSTLALGAFFFSFQIYGDFSGYSDMAIGIARLFGINLSQNFAYPYLARDIAEFWRRWHMTLTGWFRDYLYVPMGLGKRGLPAKVFNTFILFAVIGFWHGANWTFIAWGALQAVYFLPLLLNKKKVDRHRPDIVAKGKLFPSFSEAKSMLTVNLMAIFGGIFFRSENIGHAYTIIKKVFSTTLFTLPEFTGMKAALIVLLLILGFVIIEWFGRENKYAIEKLGAQWKRPLRYGMYYILIFIIFYFAGPKQEFIYFQF